MNTPNTQPINELTPAGLDLLKQAVVTIVNALNGVEHDDQRGEAPVIERIERIVPTELFDELRAYHGTIREAVRCLSDLLYGLPYLLALDGLVTDEWAQARAIMTDAEAAALIEPLSTTDGGSEPISFGACLTHGGDEGCNVVGCAWYNPNRSDECNPHGMPRPRSVADDAINRYFAQLDRGVITHTEFEALIAAYWAERGMADAEGIEKAQWMYDHDLLDAEAFWSAIEECWVEHALDALDAQHSNCGMCSCESAAEYRNAYLTARYPQITGAPAVGGEEGIG